ncbi:hypothetical protein F2Q69_00029528 [Brassica cretica]|uniref:Uncharacterized protein n=1 Tax=Brassica cretica TaxID=69181 RepID=A0A8S9RZS3_BRACR|nr:hypothetical protein F2Q69_00029528 [Brassica cretica]
MGSSLRHNSAHLRDIKGKGILYEDDDAPMFWSLFRVVTGSGTFWRNMVILEPFEVQNCTDASYARFTEEWSVCLARGSCRGDEGLSIDETALVSIDGDARIWAEHIL